MSAHGDGSRPHPSKVCVFRRVSSGDVIAEIETDKATVDFTHQDDGFLAKILLPAGSEDVKVGTVLALMVEDAKDVAAVQAAAPTPSVSASSSGPTAATAVAPAPPVAVAAHHGASLASYEAMPSARILIANLGLDPAALRHRGTGKAGRVTKADVQAFVAGEAAPVAAKPALAAAAAAAPVATAPAAVSPAPAAAAAAAPPAAAAAADFGRYVDSKPSTVRKVIATRLTESKARIPHEYAVMDCRIDALLKLRSQVRCHARTDVCPLRSPPHCAPPARSSRLPASWSA